MSRKNDRGETFAEWLVAQKGREGPFSKRVIAARVDPDFPVTGSPDDVRERLNEMQADGDMHAAVDDAETVWMATDGGRQA